MTGLKGPPTWGTRAACFHLKCTQLAAPFPATSTCDAGSALFTYSQAEQLPVVLSTETCCFSLTRGLGNQTVQMRPCVCVCVCEHSDESIPWVGPWGPHGTRLPSAAQAPPSTGSVAGGHETLLCQGTGCENKRPYLKCKNNQPCHVTTAMYEKPLEVHKDHLPFPCGNTICDELGLSYT